MPLFFEGFPDFFLHGIIDTICFFFLWDILLCGLPHSSFVLLYKKHLFQNYCVCYTLLTSSLPPAPGLILNVLKAETILLNFSCSALLVMGIHYLL